MTDYRYTLTRNCSILGAGTVCWVMLNPSTADDYKDDPTIRRVINFSSRAGYGDLIVVNLFAARATNPKELLTIPDPIGSGNAGAIETAMLKSRAVIFAWGGWWSANHKRLFRLDVEKITARMGHKPLCLGKTQNGDPRHPLYVPGTTSLEPY